MLGKILVIVPDIYHVYGFIDSTPLRKPAISKYTQLPASIGGAIVIDEQLWKKVCLSCLFQHLLKYFECDIPIKSHMFVN